jgi:hypothetical protein
MITLLAIPFFVVLGCSVTNTSMGHDSGIIPALRAITAASNLKAVACLDKCKRLRDMRQ